MNLSITEGCSVGHVSFPDWRGVVCGDRAGHWRDSYDGDVYVHWTHGLNGSGQLPADGWYSPDYLTPRGNGGPSGGIKPLFVSRG